MYNKTLMIRYNEAVFDVSINQQLVEKDSTWYIKMISSYFYFRDFYRITMVSMMDDYYNNITKMFKNELKDFCNNHVQDAIWVSKDYDSWIEIEMYVTKDVLAELLIIYS